MSILSVDNIQPIGSGTSVTVNKSVTLESGNTNITGVCTATSFSGSGANLTSLPAANLTGTLPAISGANLTSLPAQATINNNADNRVITGGSGVNLNGESKLTFDGDKLYVKNSSGNAGIDLNVSNNTNPRLDFNTANVASSGLIKSEESGNGAIMEFHNKNSSGNEQQVMTLTIDRNVYVNDGNLVIGTSGHGIDFSATANTSATGASTSNELLDDYEEGSFTPYIDRQHGSPIVGYDAQDGYYTKIGRVVYFYAECRINSYNGNGSYGNTFLRGLPFNSAARTGGRGVWNSVQYNSYYRDIDTTDGERDIAVVEGSSEKVVFYVMRSENSWTAPPAPDANDQFKIGGFYFT